MREKSLGRHPTQKPLRLVRRAVLASSVEGELVFDPFCGSGTTGVAAKELDRFFVGAEREREYAELAGRRIGAAERGLVLGIVRQCGEARYAPPPKETDAAFLPRPLWSLAYVLEKTPN
jgi:DNA modification methylase